MLFLICFMIITGLSPSCMRACITYILVLVGKNYHRKPQTIRLLLYSLIIILLINAYYIYDTGLWLSYMATIGIISFYSFLNTIIKRIIDKKSRIVEYIVNCISLSLSAQITIFPIVIYEYLYAIIIYNNIFLSSKICSI